MWIFLWNKIFSAISVNKPPQPSGISAFQVQIYESSWNNTSHPATISHFLPSRHWVAQGMGESPRDSHLPHSPPTVTRNKDDTNQKHGPLEKRMANHFSILVLRTPWTVWKGKMIGRWNELPKLVGAQYATGDQWRNNSRKNEDTEPKKNNTQLWMWLVIEVRSDAVKSNIA